MLDEEAVKIRMNWTDSE